MRGAPGWRRQFDSVNGVWKQELLVWLAQACGIRTLVETGTCEGSTPLAVHGHFDKIYTVELHDGLHDTSKRTLAHLPNVELFHDDSASFLGKLLPTLPRDLPVLFWLDAHRSGDHTAGDGTELAREVAAIAESCDRPLVVIDDEPGAELLQVAAAGVSLDKWTREYRTGEVIMHLGNYAVPPFEGSDV